MKKNSENKLLNENLKLKKDKSLLLNHSVTTNNLIAHLLFLKYQSEALSKEQKLFIAKMNHELKTPLNAILGFAQVMDKEVFGPISNEKYKRYIKKIISSGEMLLSLIENILDFSKLELNEGHLLEEKVDLLASINDSVSLIKMAFPIENKKIVIHSFAPVFIKADRRMLRQIFLNILSNAVKFTNSNGKIDVYVKKLSTGIQVVFKDNGCGIEKKKLSQLFNLNNQVISSFIKSDQGMGLGLVLVKKMVILHQGRMKVQSVLNKGTIFQIDFPKERILTGDSHEVF